MRTCPGRCLSSSCVIVAKLFLYADAPARATGRFERRLYAAPACPMPNAHPRAGQMPFLRHDICPIFCTTELYTVKVHCLTKHRKCIYYQLLRHLG